MLRLRSAAVDVTTALPEVLGLWLLVLWLPMAAALLWPTVFVIGAPFMALALCPCQAGRLRHRGLLIPRWLMMGSSVAVATWTIAAAVAVVNQDGVLLTVLTVAALAPWVGRRRRDQRPALAPTGVSIAQLNDCSTGRLGRQ